MVAWFNGENSQFRNACEVRKGRRVAEDKDCLLKMVPNFLPKHFVTLIMPATNSTMLLTVVALS